jgi:hypothetical protein
VVARRQEGRRRLRLLAGAGVVAVIGLAGVAVVESPLMAVRTVHLTGAAHESRAQILAVSGLGAKPAMIDLNAAAVARRIETLPWVATARVTRQWPSSVTVQVTERVAVAVVAVPLPAGPTSPAAVAAGAPTVLVDASGRVLATTIGGVPGLPLVAMATGSPGTPGTWMPGTFGRGIGPNTATPLDTELQLAADLPVSLSADVVSLSISPQGVLDGVVQSTLPATGSSGSGANSSYGSSSGGAAVKSPAPSGPMVPVDFGDANDLPGKIVSLQTTMGCVDLSYVTEINVSVSPNVYLTANPQPANLCTTAGG